MKKAVFVIALLTLPTLTVGWAQKPKCATNKQAIDFYEYNIRSAQIEKAKLVAIGSSGASWYDLAINDAKAKVAYLKTLPAGDLSSPCVYVYPNFDYVNGLR